MTDVYLLNVRPSIFHFVYIIYCPAQKSFLKSPLANAWSYSQEIEVILWGDFNEAQLTPNHLDVTEYVLFVLQSPFSIYRLVCG